MEYNIYIISHGTSPTKQETYGWVSYHGNETDKPVKSIIDYLATSLSLVLRTKYNSLKKKPKLVKPEYYTEGFGIRENDERFAVEEAVERIIKIAIEKEYASIVITGDILNMTTLMNDCATKSWDKVCKDNPDLPDIYKFISDSAETVNMLFGYLPDPKARDYVKAIACLDFNPDEHHVVKYDPKEYLATPRCIPRLFNFKYYVYNDDTTRHSGFHYVTASGDSPYNIGRKSSRIGYGVVKSDTPDIIITLMKKAHPFITKKDVIMALNIGVITPKIGSFLNRHLEEAIVVKNEPNIELTNTTGSIEFGSAIVPRGLMSIGAEYFSNLEKLLVNFLEDDLNDGWTKEDITDKFYTGEKANKILPDLKVGTNLVRVKLKVGGKFHTFRLILGLSCLSRNDMSGLSKDNPTVWLLYKPSDRVIDYCVVVKTDIGTGIYSSVHGDVIYKGK